MRIDDLEYLEIEKNDITGGAYTYASTNVLALPGFGYANANASAYGNSTSASTKTNTNVISRPYVNITSASATAKAYAQDASGSSRSVDDKSSWYASVNYP